MKIGVKISDPAYNPIRDQRESLCMEAWRCVQAHLHILTGIKKMPVRPPALSWRLILKNLNLLFKKSFTKS